MKSFILLLNLFLAVNISYAQCGFLPTCSNSDYTNFGMGSNSIAAEIEYDNFVSSYHSSLVRTANGEYKVWGAGFANNGTGNLTTPTIINSTNFPAITGTILKAGLASQGSTNQQGLVLTTTGLFAWGSEGLMIDGAITTSNVFQKITVNGETDGLPVGINPLDIKVMFTTRGTVALVTCSGSVYVLTLNAENAGIGGAASTTQWHQVTEVTGGNPVLSNVVAIRGQYRTLLALKSDGTLWTWGAETFLADGNVQASRNRATQMTLPTVNPIKMIGVTRNSGAGAASYYVLNADGNLYSLGENGDRQLGIWSTLDQLVWVQPRYTSAAGPVMDDIHWISAQEHDHQYSAINVINTDSTNYNWGTNNTSMLGRAGATVDPGIPTGITVTDKVLAVESGGHTSMLAKKCEDFFGYVGHKINGSMADGTTATATVASYSFATAIVYICGATTASVSVSGTPTLSPGGLYCNGTSTDLLPDPSGGILSILSGPATLAGSIITFTGSGNTTVVVQYSITVPGCPTARTATTTLNTEDCVLPTVTLSGTTTIAENAAGVATLTATLSATSPTATVITLTYTGTAIDGTDYTPSSVTITIPAGSLTGTVTIDPTDDLIFEGSETVIADITAVTSSSGVTELGTQTATVTILDDELAPTVTLSGTTTIAENAAGVATLTATLSATSPTVTTVTLTYTGTAIDGTDYTPSSVTITIPAGSLTGTVTIDPTDDLIFEGNETVIADITAVASASGVTELGTQTATVTITDNEVAPTVTLSGTTSIAENAAGVATLTATLSVAASTATTVTLTYTGTATNGTDYTPSSVTITIPAGSLTGTVTIDPTDDLIFEGNETVIADITAVSGGNGANELGTQTATVTITDNEVAPTVTLTGTTTIAENAAGVATLTATLSVAASTATTVTLTYTGTATNGTDYTPSSVTITIPAGSLTGTVTIDPTDDLIFEGSETVIADITGVSGGNGATELGTQTATVTITDNEVAPTVTLTGTTTIAENAVGVATLTATLSVATTTATTVTLTYTGTATNGTDYTPSSVTITIPAGSLTGTVTIDPTDDLISEGSETVIADITGVSGGNGATELGTQTATVTITDDEAAPTVTLTGTTTIAENAAGVATLTATLSVAASTATTVTITYTGTATNGTDYTPSSVTIVIPAGSLTGTVTIDPTDDLISEGNETVIADITGVSGGNGATELGTQTATVTIIDDEAIPTVTLTGTTTIAENAAGVATLTATLSVAASTATTVTLTYTGTATNATDYTPSSVTIVIPAGSLTGTVTIDPIDDFLTEGSETVIADITGVSGGNGATELGTQTATVTILDDDADTDGDGISDSVDIDDDNDGVLDVVEGSGDKDLDGIPNNLDLDSDNDGITDVVEAGSPDPDNNGIVGTGAVPPVDVNGLATTLSGIGVPNADKDGDGIPNSQDLDSDNDGITDVVENGITDANNDGLADGTDADTDGILSSADQSATFGDAGNTNTTPNADGDTVANYLDIDSDNDGITDVIENGLTDADNNGIVDGTDADADGLMSSADQSVTFGDAGNTTTTPNKDGDAVANYLDIDSDNDGITDVDENGLTDADNNGIVDGTDADADGLLSSADQSGTFGDAGNTTTTPNKDGDTVANYLDIDSDNDGITDVIENGLTDADNNGIVDGTDADADGLLSSADQSATFGDAGNTNTTLNADGDTVANYLDIDSDNDGITDVVENGLTDADNNGIVDGTDADADGLLSSADQSGTFGDAGNTTTTPNKDGDTVANYLDIDSDNDGITDVVENGLTDADNNGIVDGTDADADGLLSSADQSATFGDAGNTTTTPNKDGDTVANYLDIDSDNDGITDVVENGLTDADNNGIVDGTDADADGLLSSADQSATFGDAGNTTTTINTDGDSVANYLDIDSDNDGITDVIENGLTDADNNGIVDGTDADADGLLSSADQSGTFGDAGNTTTTPNKDGDAVANYLDIDSDNDGITDVVENGLTDADNNGIVDGTDADADGLMSTADQSGTFGDAGNTTTTPNTDGDAVANYLDIDSDNDGITDVTENGLTDADNNGLVDGTDADSDGLLSTADQSGTFGDAGNTNTLINTDGNGNPNYLDIDSDNDGIVDNIEGQSSGGYIVPMGIDTDADGLDNAYDATNGGTSIVLENTDGATDGADYVDTDADNDGDLDALEGWDTNNDGTADVIPTNTDADNDGLDNAFDVVTLNGTTGPNGTNSSNGGTVPSDFPNLDITGTTELDWRELNDNDGDGIVNNLDPDDDNDGIVDIVEGTGDTDGDGIIDAFDLDSDNDGITDVTEAGGNDPDGDGIIGTGIFVDTDNDGLSDIVDTDNGGTPLITPDTDGDSNPDYIDLDSDNDGITDVTEAGGNDSDGDGEIDGYTDTDNDGLSDNVDPNNGGTMLPIPDTDGDGIIDVLDLDSDNDGITDVTEAGGIDADGDGEIDGFTDTDNDGLSDNVDPNNGGTMLPIPDTDGDGIIDVLDLDSDNDGITDVTEAGGIDADGDGEIDGFTDTDNDGLSDNVDPNNGGTILPIPDTDGDSNPDYMDLDSDNDGITDVTEAGGIDADGDGEIDGFTDTDNDGLSDNVDPNNGGTMLPIPDTDGDGNIDVLDLDSDNDGITDVTEAGGIDADGDGEIDGFTDTDNDGLSDNVDPNNGGTMLPIPDTDGDGNIDVLDLDSDNDGITDVTEAGGVDTNGDGIIDGFTDSDNDGLSDNVDPNNGGSILANGDFDMDGVENYLDLDSDNDGIVDVIEAGGVDANGDGIIDGFTDTDNDGLSDNVDTNNGGTMLPIPDTDASGSANYLDIDADNDGIVDNIEGQSSAGYVSPSGLDTDGDGWDDAYDSDNGGTAFTVENTDGSNDGADYVDLDTDNDGDADLLEGWDTNNDGTAETTPSGTDSDNDGLDDAYDTVVLDGTTGPNGNNSSNGGTVPSDFPNMDITTTTELDWREDYDSDGDGVTNGTEITDGTNPNDPCDFIAASITLTPGATWLAADCDGDGVTNGTEITDTTDPNDPCDFVTASMTLAPNAAWLNADCDGDGVTNGTEVTDGTDPNDPCDYVMANITLTQGGNWNNADCDEDGVTNGTEVTDTTDPNDPCDFVAASITLTPGAVWMAADCDGDGVTNGTELTDGTDPNDPCEFIAGNITLTQSGAWLTADCDGDGVPNGTELTDGTDPNDPCEYTASSITLTQGGIWNNADCDGDGVINGTEVTDGTNPNDPCEFVFASMSLTPSAGWNALDCDGDGVTNGTEVTDGTDPNDPCEYTAGSITLTQGGNWNTADCDGDGVTNGTEVADNTDPNDPCDYLAASITLTQGGNWNTVDCDGDGVTNGTEVTDNTDPNDPCDYVAANGTLPQGGAWATADCDGDGVTNETEVTDGTDPNDPCSFIDTSITLPITVPCVEGLFVPDGFSPNGDGVNDVVVIIGLDNYPDNKFTVMNRWGNKVFESENYQNDWNGNNQFGLTIGGEELPIGTYFFILELGPDHEPITGYIYLNR